MKQQENEVERSFLTSIGCDDSPPDTAIQRLQADLLSWYAVHKRDLPWRRTRDPYAIWISEIMLQQTRVAAAIPYYERFLARFPNVNSLATAPESELLACWAGLGYYHRARNLQRAAREIVQAGAFPSDYEEIRRLPGVGDYTAAAIASIAFDLPFAAVDGNAFRVLSRLFDDATNIASIAGRKHFAAIAGRILPHDQPGAFNQAIMELGATICLPNNPQCLLCPVAGACQARAAGRQAELPVKIVTRNIAYETRRLLWIERDDGLLVWQRPPDATLMPGFWELPEAGQIPGAVIANCLARFRHTITFRHYQFEVFAASIAESRGSCQWLSWQELDQVPASTVLKKARRAVSQLRAEAKPAQEFAATLGRWEAGMKKTAALGLFMVAALLATAQTPAEGLKQRDQAPPGQYQVAAGTHILLRMINSVNTRVAQPGDRIYLETAFPILANGRIVIPQGSWVTGTVTEVKRPGRVKGKGELRVQFDSLMLPNGVTRSFHSNLSGVDQDQRGTFNRENGKVTGPGSKKDDVSTVATTTAGGTVIGSGIGAAAGNVGRGAGIGVGAGAAAGLLGVLLTRGPDATLPRGSTVEMVLDRPLAFQETDLDFSKVPPARPTPESATPQANQHPGFTRFRY